MRIYESGVCGSFASLLYGFKKLLFFPPVLTLFMKRFFRLFTFYAAPVAVHWSFLFIMGWLVLASVLIQQPATSGLPEVLPKLMLLSGVLASVAGPALLRAWIAVRLNEKVEQIRLLPVGADVTTERTVPLGWPNWFFYLVGPVVNLLIALVVFLLMPLETDKLFTDWPEPASNQDELSVLFWLNLGLAVLPLLPTFVAGSNALWLEVLSLRMDRSQAIRVITFMGKGIALGVMLAGAVLSVELATFGVLLFVANHTQRELARRLKVVKDVTVKQVMNPHLVRVLPTERIQEILSRETILGKEFVVVEHDKVLGVLSFIEIARLYQAGADRLPVAYVMERNFTVLDVQEKLEQVCQQAQWEAAPVYLIYQQGQPAGVVRPESVAEVILRLREESLRLIP